MIEDPFIRARDGADALVEGFYLIARRSAGRVDIPVRIWFGPPLDEDGDELDRSPRWQIMIAGMLVENEPIRVGGRLIEQLSDFWPFCGTEPISEAEYRYRIERQEWAAAYDPNDPFGTPGGKINAMTATLPFI